MIDRIDENFVLIIFSSSFNKIDMKDRLNLPIKLIKLLKSIPESKLVLLQKIFIVHHNWLTKSLLDLLNVVRFTDIKIVHCDNLITLSRHLDITQLNISLPTYLYDLNFNDKIILPIHLTPIFNTPINHHHPETLKIFKRIYNKLIDYLSSGDYSLSKLVQGNLTQITLNKIEILHHCIRRRQIINLSDWSFTEIYKIMIEFITSLNEIDQPLIPVSLVLKGQHFYQILNNQYQFEESYNNKYLILKLFQMFQIILSKLDQETEKLLYILELSKSLFNITYESENHSEIFKTFYEFIKDVLLGDAIMTSVLKFDLTEYELVSVPLDTDISEESRLNRVGTLKDIDSSNSPTPAPAPALAPPVPLKASQIPTDAPNTTNALKTQIASNTNASNIPKQASNTPKMASNAPKQVITNTPESVTELESQPAEKAVHDSESSENQQTPAEFEAHPDNDDDKENLHLRLKPRYERLVKLTKPTIEERQEMAKIEKEIKLAPWVKGKKVGELLMFYEREMDY